MKLKKKEEDAKAKEELKKKKENENPNTNKPKKDVDIDPTKYFDNRKDMIMGRIKSGDNAFPHKFEVTMTNAEFIEKFEPITKKGEFLKDNCVSVAGRVYSSRSASSKLIFYDIISDGKQIQIYCNAR